MAGYRLTLILVLIVSAVYALVAFETHPRRNQEFFPFFTWSLFSYTGSERDDYTLALTSLDGEAFESPVLITDIVERFPGLRRDYRFRKIIWRWVSALYADDKEAMDDLRAIIEAQYFSAYASVQYDLVMIRYRPIERYQDPSKVEIVERLGSHHYAQTAP